MIDTKTCREILSLYAKHGWTLRRVLLSGDLKRRLSDEPYALFGHAAIFDSPIDALWFSRASEGGRETWELRHLSDTPFALVEVMENGLDPNEREDILKNTETRLREMRSKIPQSH